MSWNPTGTAIAGSWRVSDGVTVAVWNVATQALVCMLKYGCGIDRAVLSAAWSPCGELLLTATNDGQVRVHRLTVGQLIVAAN